MNKPIPVSALQQQQAGQMTSDRAGARIAMGALNLLTMRKHDIKQYDSERRTVWTEDDFPAFNGIYAILAGIQPVAMTDDHVVDRGSNGTMTSTMREKIDGIADEVFRPRVAPTLPVVDYADAADGETDADRFEQQVDEAVAAGRAAKQAAE